MKATINLFCLPFAGGNKYSYQKYIEKAPSFLNIIPLEYPGRGARMKESLISDADVLVNDLYEQIKKNTDQSEYAIYGHSMGGLIGYLLTRKLIENNHKQPVHLFITGTTGPSSASRSAKNRHLLPKDEFIQELKNLDGIPDEILQNEDLLSYIEPILRADFKTCETYQYSDYPPLNIPLTVITGTDEEMEMADIHLWQKETECTVDFKQIPGKHFFIFKYPRVIVDIISKKLSVHTKAYQL
ncbi:MAG: thioesterase [Chitinophagaceae bacterium]|nr:thioesterase [Chitinophagaceae bacterium]